MQNIITKGLAIICKAKVLINTYYHKQLYWQFIYHTFIYPYLIYCIKFEVTLKKRLLKTHKKIIQIITHNKPRSETINILPFPTLVHERIWIAMFKLDDSLLPLTLYIYSARLYAVLSILECAIWRRAFKPSNARFDAERSTLERRERCDA